MKKIPYQTYLEPNELPRAWYNIQADMPTPLAPSLNAATNQLATFEEMSRLLAPQLVEQEVSTERYIDIPEPVLELYAQYRPSPLARAYRLEKALGTPAHIYYKYEGNNPSGSHKLNSAIPQVYYNQINGIRKITTETGAGQWGTALAVAAKMFGVELDVYMVRISAQQKPYRKMIMETFGANVIPSPSPNTKAGRQILAENPHTPGSLGMAISEAVEVTLSDPSIRYCLGSVLNHVVLHQSIIGQEALLQLNKIEEKPDIVIGCNGGGSNFGGFAFPIMGEQLRNGGLTSQFIAVEASACPKLTKGVYAYDFSDAVGATPACPMYTLGHGFVPQGIHAGGLRYHGDSPILSRLYHDKLVDAVSVDQSEVFRAAMLFAENEIIVPAPESAHAIAVAIQKALECKETGETKNIVFCLSGNGYFDLAAYEQFLSGELIDAPLTEEALKKGVSSIPQLAKID